MTNNEIKDTYGVKTWETMFDSLLNHSVHTLVEEILQRLTDQEIQAWASRIIQEQSERD
jgi:hypothetical protein